MDVLVMWPPHIPSYFNAGHHLTVFQTAAYLRERPGVDSVRAVDAGALNTSWKELGDLIFQGQFDIVLVVNDFDNVDDLPRLIRYVRRLSPGTKVITGGRLSSQAPQAFRELDLDAVVESGDLEAGVAAYLESVRRPGAAALPGVAVRAASGWTPAAPGIALPPDEWRLPDVSEIPYGAYDRMYQRDQNKFCGIPRRRELVVPVARGCPVNCSFCEVPAVQGRRERRIAVERAVTYIADSFAAHPFEYVAFYAPTFTLDRTWTERLCAELAEQPRRYPWKCATTIAHLDPELVKLMADAGCVRISVGLETLELAGLMALPRSKRTHLDRFHGLADACKQSTVELNCFVVVGLPGTTAAGTARTVEEIRAVGGRVRPTIYSSLARLRAARDLTAAAAFNRQLLHDEDVSGCEDPADFHRFLFGPEDWVTPVTERIPTRP